MNTQAVELFLSSRYSIRIICSVYHKRVLLLIILQSAIRTRWQQESKAGSQYYHQHQYGVRGREFEFSH